MVLVAASDGGCPLKLVALNSCREADYQSGTPTADAAASYQDLFADWAVITAGPCGFPCQRFCRVIVKAVFYCGRYHVRLVRDDIASLPR